MGLRTGLSIRPVSVVGVGAPERGMTMKATLLAAVAVLFALPGCYKGTASSSHRSVSMCETMGDCWKRCERQDGSACTNAGALFVARGESTHNYSSARDAYHKACTLGHAAGCVRAASFAIDTNTIKRLNARACKLRDARGCSARVPSKLSLRRLTRACVAGNRVACKIRGRKVATHELQTSSLTLELRYLESGCRYLEPNSCSAVGAMYRDGKGTTRNVQRAYDAFHRACDHGDTKSCRALGSLYETQAVAGKSIGKRNLGHTVTAYSGACSNGDTIACLRFAQALKIGDGVTRNRARAASIFERCCAHGETRGCIAAAKMYRQGWGVSFNPTHAAKLLRKGCGHGDATACRELASLYSNGRGVKRSSRKAGDLLARACTMGSTLACDEQQRRLKRLTRPATADHTEFGRAAFPAAMPTATPTATAR